MADHDEGNASDENTIIRSHQSSLPSINAQDPDEEIMPRALFLDIRDNNHHLDLDSLFQHSIILEIIRGHPLLQALTRVELVPVIYLQQFWHTLRYHATTQPPQFIAKIDHFDVRITLRGLRRALDLPYVDNFDNPALEVQLFEDIRSLGYQDPENPVLSSSTQFRPKHLPPIWYTLCSILNRCMTSKHTGIDKANISTLRMFHAFAFNLHIDYAVLLWNEMVELVADQTMASRISRRRNFVPFQRFFQILIHQAMEDNDRIPRREQHPRGPSQYMHRLHIPRHSPFALIAVIRQDVLDYADEASEVVIRYREQNALMAQPDPAGPAQDAIPLGGEGPNVEGVQEQEGVPEQREVRHTIRKRVGESSTTASHASSSMSTRSDHTPPRADEEEHILPHSDNDDDDDQDPEAQLIPRRSGKRPRVETSDADSVWHNEPMDTMIETTGPSQRTEGVEVDVEMEIVDTVEEGGRKETSDHVIESDKVLTTDSSQADLSRVPTSSANVRLSPLSIETAMVRPTMQCTTPPSHSSVSQQIGVSFSTGEFAHTLSAAQSVLAGIEAGRLLPRPPPFFQSTSSLAPFGIPSFLRSPLSVQHQVGSFRAPTGTPVVPPPFVGASRGSGGSPIIANTMPALNIGHTVSATVMSTSNLSGLGVSSAEAEIRQAISLIGPPPHHFMPYPLMSLFVKSIDNSLAAHANAMQEQMRKLREDVNSTVKGKGIADSPSPASQPTSAEPSQQPPPSIPLHLIPEDQLKTELLSRLLAQFDPRTGENADLISLLRLQTQHQPPPTPQALPSEAPLLVPQFVKLNASISNMADSFSAGFTSLVKRVEVVEQACGIQAESSQKRRHDDPDDPDHHEGEKSTGTGVGTAGTSTAGTSTAGTATEGTGTATEGNTGTGATDSETVHEADVTVLADVVAGVEKPSASDNRTGDDWATDIIHIDSDEETERTNIQIKQEIEDVFHISGSVIAISDSDTEAPAKSSQPLLQTDQSAGTSAPSASILQPTAPVIRVPGDDRILDPVKDAELRLFERIIADEPRFVATGLRVRIQTPYQESIHRDMFLREIQKITWEKVYGIEDWPNLHKIEYLHFMKYECQKTSVVRSEKSIVKILKIDSRKLSKVWFPEFTVQRSDGKIHHFSEADFQSLKLEDLCNLYEILSRDSEKKGEWQDAYQSIKRFMKNILKFSYLKDFQMALEAHQERVNIRPPNRGLPNILSFPAYTVLDKPELGVVYVDSDSKKRFMRVCEAHKFSDGTLKMIQIHLESKFRLDTQREEMLSKNEKELIREVLDAINYRKGYRNALRRFEITFGLRKTQVVPVNI